MFIPTGAIFAHSRAQGEPQIEKRTYSRAEIARCYRVPSYVIDHTGTDAAKIAELEATIRSMNGSIEKRAVAAVLNAKRRGGHFNA